MVNKIIDDRDFRYLKVKKDTYSIFDSCDFCVGEVKILDGDIVFNPLDVHYKIYDFTSIELMSIIKLMSSIKEEVNKE